jgi:hypothetical protein
MNGSEAHAGTFQITPHPRTNIGAARARARAGGSSGEESARLREEEEKMPKGGEGGRPPARPSVQAIIFNATRWRRGSPRLSCRTLPPHR